MKHYVFGLAVAMAAALTGCQTPEGAPYHTGTGALVGTGVGAATGALIGGEHHAGEGALIGGAVGAITGGLIGNSMDQQQRAQLAMAAPQTYQRIDQGQPLGLEDIKAMTRAGISDSIIISQIHNTRTIYRLNTADIIDLHNSGVSPAVIDAMINTGGGGVPEAVQQPMAQPPIAQAPMTQPLVTQDPPPPLQDTPIVEAPGPGYVWIGGDWVWNRGWVWTPGRWVIAPHPGAVWVQGGWVRGPHGWYHRGGYWH